MKLKSEFYFYDSEDNQIQPTACYCDHNPASSTVGPEKLIDNTVSSSSICQILWYNEGGVANNEGSCRFIFRNKCYFRKWTNY